MSGKAILRNPTPVEFLRFTLGTTTAGEIAEFCGHTNIGIANLPEDFTQEQWDAATDIRWLIIDVVHGNKDVHDGEVILKHDGSLDTVDPEFFDQIYVEVP